MGVGRIFSRRGPLVDSSEIAKNIFPGGGEIGEIHLSPSKLRKQPFLLKIP